MTVPKLNKDVTSDVSSKKLDFFSSQYFYPFLIPKYSQRQLKKLKQHINSQMHSSNSESCLKGKSSSCLLAQVALVMKT